MADLKKLLRKRSWTGRELGILEVSNMAICFRQEREGKPTKPLFDKEKFLKMLDSFYGTDKKSTFDYNGYMAIHKWITLYWNIALANEQQAQLRYKSLQSFLENAILAEEAYSYIAKLPRIMTEKQYNNTVERRLKKMFKYKDPVFTLIYRAMQYYIDLLYQDPEKENPLKPIRDKYLTANIENPLIKSKFFEYNDLGYYELEDGRRSDQMTEEEWTEALSIPGVQEYVESIERPSMDDIKLTLDELMFYYDEDDKAEAQLIKRAKAFLEPTINTFAEETTAAPCEFHPYPEQPENVTKWEVLKRNKYMYNIFRSLIFLPAEVGDVQDGATLDTVAFYEEFKDAVEAVTQEIDKLYYGGKPVFSSIDPEDWVKTVSWETLYKADFYGMKKKIDDMIWTDKKAVRNGIAIIKDTTAPPSSIDAKGNYLQPNFTELLQNMFGLEGFFTDSENYDYFAGEAENSRKRLLGSYYFLKAYNQAIDMVADYFDVPDIDIFKINIEQLEDKIDSLNDLSSSLFVRVRIASYDDKSIKEKKLQVIKEFFTEIDYKSLTIPEEKIEAVKAGFKNFAIFADPHQIANTMFFLKDRGADDNG